MRYRGDPYWTAARRPGRCAGTGCTEEIPGDRIFWYPTGRSAFVGGCAERNARDFAAHAADEDRCPCPG